LQLRGQAPSPGPIQTDEKVRRKAAQVRIGLLKKFGIGS
jgi:hypothetical protein